MTRFSRTKEFPQLRDVVYLDHTGATLPSASQLDGFHQDLKETLYANPHSRSASSSLTTEAVDQMRFRVLKHFNTTADKHSVVFTFGCTAALKLLAETFDWHGSPAEQDGGLREERDDQKVGLFCYLQDNHTSVVGMREVARSRGAQIRCVTEADVESALGVLNEYAHVGKNDRTVQAIGETSGSTRNGILPSNTNIDHTNLSQPNSLFAFPAQSNFSGRKYPLEWVNHIGDGHLGRLSGDRGDWSVVLDAAALVSTSPLDLSVCKADFITISFYKMFGFPTGLGALIVRNESAHFLSKDYFGGGTVMAYLANEKFHKARASLAERLEDGTLPFLNIVGLRHGFDALEKLGGGMQAISEHTYQLAKQVHDALSTRRHQNGHAVAKLYCRGQFASLRDQGPIVNFNLLRSNGEYVGYAEVERLAAIRDIHLRTGCFCNTGACQQHLNISNERIRANLDAGHVCGDSMDLIDGHPTGSVRISFGYMSNQEDVDRFLDFVHSCIIDHAIVPLTSPASVPHTSMLSGPLQPSSSPPSNRPPACATAVPVATSPLSPRSVSSSSPPFSSSSSSLSSLTGKEDGIASGRAPRHRGDVDTAEEPISGIGEARLCSIYIYPVKSCGAMEVREWELGVAGLKYDRHWMIVNEGGVYMSQKRISNLCLIKPLVDLRKRQLVLTYPDTNSCCLPLDIPRATMNDVALCQGKVCGDRIATLDCGDEVAAWLTKVTGQKCRLQQQDSSCQRTSKQDGTAGGGKSTLSLANHSHYLLINTASTASLRAAMHQSPHLNAVPTTDNLVARFRPNLVVEGCDAFDEESWSRLTIGGQTFEVKSRCNRCQMICVDQGSGSKGLEPLFTLSAIRGKKLFFGVHVMNGQDLKDGHKLKTGDAIKVLERLQSVETTV